MSHFAEILTPAEASTHLSDWHDLAARAIESNIFYCPQIAVPGLALLPEGQEARVAMAWRRESDGSNRLVGVLPIVGLGRRYLLPLPGRGAAELYGRLSTPLLDMASPVETMEALLSACSRSKIHGLFLRYAHDGGAAAAALATACALTGRQIVHCNRFERAFLRSDLPAATYIRETLNKRRRWESNRQHRRLAEVGTVSFEVATAPQDVSTAIEEFLTLESLGWKGDEQTAMLLSQGSAEFLRRASAMLSSSNAMRVALLKLDGRTIAAGIVAIAGRRAFYLKTTYDESFFRFSPGWLLTLQLTSYLLDDPEIEDGDSIAVVDHPMMNRIWTARFPIVSILVETGTKRRTAFLMLRFAEGLRDRLRRGRQLFRDYRASGLPSKLKPANG